MIKLANGLDRLLQLPIIVQPAANLGDPLPTYAQLTRTPTRIGHRQDKHPMTFTARTLRTTAPMTDNALKQQKLAADWKPIHELLPSIFSSHREKFSVRHAHIEQPILDRLSRCPRIQRGDNSKISH